MSTQRDYWKECISLGADEFGLVLTESQLDTLAESVEGGHDNYGMAFYTPPSSDRLNSIEREWKAKVSNLEKDLAEYRTNAETAVKRAMKLRSDDSVSIAKHGHVFLHGGRTEQIQ